MNIYTPNQNDIIHETSVDFVLRPCAKEIHIVQYDKSLPIVKVELFRNGERYVLPENAIVNIRVGKLDHTFVYESILGTNEQRNIVYFEVSEQMATIPGRIWPVLEVIENSKVACSSPLCFIIERNPIQEGQIESHDDFPIIYELQGTVADHETRITALESQVSGDVVTLHTDQYNIDGKKGFTSDIYVDSTGTLSLRFTPTLSSHAVNKGYVDQAIENVEIRSDVIDVLGTHDDLENYDTSDVRLNDLIKVISDETRNNATTYYRWATIEGTNQWDFVALEGPYYTISQIDTIIERVDDDIADVDDRKLELHPFDGFVGGTQVCDQVSNGQIMYCQSGTQSEIDPTQSPIINIELTQEHISSVSNRKAMYIKKIHIEYESDDEPGVNKTWEYTFVSRIFGSGTNQDDINPKVVVLADSTVNPIAVLNTHLELDNYDTSGVESGNIIKVLSDEEHDDTTTYYKWDNEWVLIQNIELEWTLIYRPATGKQYFGSYNATKGQQFGSNSNPADYISLYTTSLQNVIVKNVTIEVSGNSGTQAQAKITLVQDVWEYTPEESEESTSSPVITASNESYPFYHGEEGTHLGTGGGTIIQYEHVFLKKENGEVSVIEPNSDYLYIEENGTNDSYRLYKYVDIQMQEVSKTRLGSTSDTAYRGDYGQDNYNKLKQVREQTFTFTGVKTFDSETWFNSIIYVDHIKATDEDGGYHTLATYNSDGYYWILENVSIIGQDSLIFMQAEDSNDPGYVVSPLNADSYRIMNLADPINDTDAVNKKYADTKYAIPSGGIPASDLAEKYVSYTLTNNIKHISDSYTFDNDVHLTNLVYNGSNYHDYRIRINGDSLEIARSSTSSGSTVWSPLFMFYSDQLVCNRNLKLSGGSSPILLTDGTNSISVAQIVAKYDKPSTGIPASDLADLDASKITSGTFADARIASASTWNAKYDKPSTGIPASDLADTYVLANTAIVGATKCKITYDAKGLVTGGADLAASDIPSLDASKITSGTFADARIASASAWNAKSVVSVSGTGTSTTPISYITINGTEYQIVSSANAIPWGNITGSLSAQTDLQNALDTKSTKSEVPNYQASTIVVKDAVTNVNGKSLTSFHAENTTISGYEAIRIFTSGLDTLTLEQASTYMEAQTGSKFVPTYNYDNPLNSYLLFENGKMYKPQWDSTYGLVLYYMTTVGATTLYKHHIVNPNNSDIYIDIISNEASSYKAIGKGKIIAGDFLTAIATAVVDGVRYVCGFVGITNDISNSFIVTLSYYTSNGVQYRAHSINLNTYTETVTQY